VLKQPNIHLVGEVGMRSPEFYEVMDKCAFVILPSCSEGQAGSVVEAMNQGLIPIVSKATRLDARAYGVVLETVSIRSIQRVVKKMSVLSPAEVKKLSLKTRTTAQTEHSAAHFRSTLKQLIIELLGVLS
jgi:glycosyltransferase involved in cell wall biosynthesis